MQLSDVFLMIEADFLQPFFFKAVLSASSSRDEAMSPPVTRISTRPSSQFLRPSETKGLSSAISIYYNIIMTDQSHFAVRLFAFSESRIPSALRGARPSSLLRTFRLGQSHVSPAPGRRFLLRSPDNFRFWSLIPLNPPGAVVRS